MGIIKSLQYLQPKLKLIDHRSSPQTHLTPEQTQEATKLLKAPGQVTKSTFGKLRRWFVPSTDDNGDVCLRMLPIGMNGRNLTRDRSYAELKRKLEEKLKETQKLRYDYRWIEKNLPVVHGTAEACQAAAQDAFLAWLPPMVTETGRDTGGGATVGGTVGQVSKKKNNKRKRSSRSGGGGRCTAHWYGDMSDTELDLVLSTFRERFHIRNTPILKDYWWKKTFKNAMLAKRKSVLVTRRAAAASRRAAAAKSTFVSVASVVCQDVKNAVRTVNFSPAKGAELCRRECAR